MTIIIWYYVLTNKLLQWQPYIQICLNIVYIPYKKGGRRAILLFGSFLFAVLNLFLGDKLRKNSIVPKQETFSVRKPNHTNNASISSQCRAFEQNSTKRENFCNDVKECQRTKVKRQPPTHSINDTFCQTLWITCISLEFQQEINNLSGDGYWKTYHIPYTKHSFNMPFAAI